MASAFVQQASGQVTGTQTVGQVTISPTAGNGVILVLFYEQSGNRDLAANAIKDQSGNNLTYIEVGAGPASNADYAGMHVVFIPNIRSGVTRIDATLASASSAGIGAVALEYSGLKVTAVIAGYNNNGDVLLTAGTGTDNLSLSFTPTGEPGRLFGVAIGTNYTAPAAGTGFTSRANPTWAGLAFGSATMRVVDATYTGLTSQTVNFTGTNGANYLVSMFAVEDAPPAGTPVITTVSTATPTEGGSLVITGTDFQASQSTGYVQIGGVNQTVTAWGDTSITITVVLGTNLFGTSVNVRVTNSLTYNSNVSAVQIQPPSGYDYVTLVSVNSTAAYRITAAGDLAIGNQIEWDNALVTVYDDGTFSADASVTSFNVRVGVTTDGWGAWALQTINGSSSAAGFSGVPVRRAFNKRSGLGF